MASQNDGFDIKSGVLSSFDFITTEEATTGAIIASTCLTDDSSVVHNTGAETVSGVKTFSNGLINGSLFFGLPITTTTLSGNATWNDALSRQRAQSVVNFLTDRYRIDSTRLTPVGKGFSEPLDGADVSDPKNRRVQFRVTG